MTTPTEVRSANDYAVGRVRHAKRYAVSQKTELARLAPGKIEECTLRQQLGSAMALAFERASETGKAHTVFYLVGNRWHSFAKVRAWP